MSSQSGKWEMRLAIAFSGLIAASARAAIAAPATQPSSSQQSNVSLQEQVNELNAKVEKLEANQQSSNQQSVTAAKPSSSVIGGWNFSLVNESNAPDLLSTADLASGYDPMLGFVLRSDDGEFSLHPGLVFQFRNTTNYREQLSPGNGSEVPGPRYSTENGFTVARARLSFDGNFTKNVTYYIQFQDDQGAAFNLLDAYATYHFSDTPFSFRVGQFKDPVWHERNLSEATLMAADRTLVESLLGGESSPISRLDGVALLYDHGPFRAQAVFDNGFDTANTKFYDSGGIGAGVTGASGVTPMDYGVSTRAEGILIGQRNGTLDAFSQYDRGFTALDAKQNILVIGGGGDFSQAGSNSLLLHSVDLQYDNTCGASAYAAYYGSYRDLHHDQGVTPGFYYDSGFEVQTAYLVTHNIEPFVRYDYTHLAPGSTTGLSSNVVQEFTVGANYYIHKQNVKFTLDASYLPNGAPADDDSAGILKDSGHNELVVRAQLQLAM